MAEAPGQGVEIMSEDTDIRKRRAAYRSAHRGTKEMDHLLGKFAQAHLENMDEPQLARFEQFIALPDPELQGWLMAPERPSGTDYDDLVTAVRAFHGLK